jgi:magnesium-transporting ATPase (P-type)
VLRNSDLGIGGTATRRLAVAIVAVILVSGLFSLWQERRAHQALEALQRLLPAAVRVRRDGITGDLPVTALVPGDMIALTEGDQVRWRHRVVEAESAMAREGLRVLALAYRHLPQRLERDRLEDSLILAGLVGLEDPRRAEVPAALEQCRRAGIRVVMVTGDHPETAHAIARAIGLVRRDAPTVMTGETLNALSDAELRHGGRNNVRA